jgi:H+/Cl- antiporter ClcA
MMLDLIRRRERGARLGIFLGAGAVTGLAAVLFMWGFEFALEHQLNSARIGAWIWIVTPLIFVLSVELIRRIAPYADGAGIPQTIFAATHLTEISLARISPLVSFRTMTIKVIALLLAVWAGASTGREGPTVHVAACIFSGIVLIVQRFTKLKMDLRSAVIAGGAAGLAAAFNTPLAGVTFAIEELSTDYFASIKESVLMAIIIAGIAAKTLIGEYAYFGRLAVPAPVSMTTVLLIGLAGGLCGALFSTALIQGRRFITAVRMPMWRYLIPALFAFGLLVVNRLSSMEVLGPGNRVAQIFVTKGIETGNMFPVLKMIATLFTYWSGIAGGIFAPCLSIGAGLGADIGFWAGDATAPCALIGMAAFLAGTIQAPITAFVIIFEMTGHHELLLPIMLASLIAVLTAKAFGAKHLYQTLADSYGQSLGYKKVSNE